MITTVDGASTADPTAAAPALRWLSAQSPPYTPTVLAHPGQHLVVRFPVPSPLTLPTG